MRNNRTLLLFLVAGLLLVLSAAPSLAGQPQSGQPGHTEGQPGGQGGNPGDNNQNQPGNQGG